MIQIKEAVIVEGKYDKIKLSSIIDGLIIETHGFRIFKDERQMALIRRMAETRGLLILTDSDSAGFLIRHHLMGAIPERYIKHAYIPDVLGKERRKEKSSKEGKLGVEGVSKRQIIQALERAGVICGETACGQSAENRDAVQKNAAQQIEKSDLFRDGLTGTPNSAQNRQQLLRHLNLPEHLSTNAMLKVLNSMMSREEYERLIAEILQ